MLKWRNVLSFYPLNELISNLMPATGLKLFGAGATKGWKSKIFWEDSAGRTLTTNYVTWHQLCNRIIYKRDVLERQSLQSVKEWVKRLWNTLKTTFLNVKLQRLFLFFFYHLQCITSSKYSEKLEKPLCFRDKAEDLCWMPVVFGPSDDTASLIGMILSLTLLDGPRNTSRNHCR